MIQIELAAYINLFDQSVSDISYVLGPLNDGNQYFLTSMTSPRTGLFFLDDIYSAYIGTLVEQGLTNKQVDLINRASFNRRVEMDLDQKLALAPNNQVLIRKKVEVRDGYQRWQSTFATLTLNRNLLPFKNL